MNFRVKHFHEPCDKPVVHGINIYFKVISSGHKIGDRIHEPFIQADTGCMDASGEMQDFDRRKISQCIYREFRHDSPDFP